MNQKQMQDEQVQVIEHTVGTPNLIDMSEFLTHKRDIESSSTSNRHTLKPIKTPIITKRFYKPKNANIENITVPKPQFNPKNKVVYIKYFNDIKKDDPNPYRDVHHKVSFDPVILTKKKRKRDFLNPISKSEISATISFFRENMKKYNPTLIKQPERPTPVEDDEESQDGDFAFLTGVQIKGEKKKKPDEAEVVPTPEVFETMSEGAESVHELPVIENKKESDRASVSYSTGKYKLTGTGIDTKFISSSEANYERIKRTKPKIYISARANSIQPTGRPLNYKDHLVRIYGKEATPTVPYNIENQFGSKKDLRKQMAEAYLGDFNLDALKADNPIMYNILTNNNDKSS